MKVFYWTQLFWPYVGGVEVLASQFLPEMQERGYAFNVITSHGSLDLPDQEEHHGIMIHRFPFLSAIEDKNFDDILSARSRLIALKKELRPDLVHVNLTDPSIFFHWQSNTAAPSRTLVSTRVALTVESATPETLIGKSLRSADWITTNSKAMLMDIHQLVPETRTNSSYIYNALKAPSVQPTQLNIATPRLLCLGRVVKDKGFDVALRALPLVRQDYSEVELIIAGDGPAKPELENLAAELGVAEAVHFTGWIEPDKVYDLINSVTIVLIPSRWREAFGLVALQAAQLARPVVATKVGGLSEVVADNETGLLIPNEDHEALARAVITLLDHPDQASNFGQNAATRSEKLFNWERYLNAYDSLYKQLIERGRTHA